MGPTERVPLRSALASRVLVVALDAGDRTCRAPPETGRRTLHRCGTVPELSPDFADVEHCDRIAAACVHSQPSWLTRADARGATRSTPPTQDPDPTELRRAASLLVVNTGDGKGKSSAAFGVMIRGVARGWNVAVVQFIKSGDWKVGEEKIGRQLGVDWHRRRRRVHVGLDDLDHDRDARTCRAGQQAADIIRAGEHQLVDPRRADLPVELGVDRRRRRRATRCVDRPPHVNVIVTGRDAPPALIEIADTVTEMREVKHAYDRASRRSAASTTDMGATSRCLVGGARSGKSALAVEIGRRSARPRRVHRHRPSRSTTSMRCAHRTPPRRAPGRGRRSRQPVDLAAARRPTPTRRAGRSSTASRCGSATCSHVGESADERRPPDSRRSSTRWRRDPARPWS